MDTSKQMLAMKANKKLLQRQLQESTSKDLHNIAATITSAPVGGSILQTLVNDVRKESGSLTEIVTSDCNELRALYYQSSNMQKMQRKISRVASYKLNDVCMPLYALMVEDGNGGSQLAALWLVANEERDTILALMDMFVRHNDCAGVQCVMTDKDMLERDTEREVTAGSHPDLHLSCPAHLPVRAKMGISQEQRLGILNILQRLAYADLEEIYTTAYVELVGFRIGKLSAYYNNNWHPIRLERVHGMKHNKFSMHNSTNNRVESMNKHLKSVITKYSNIETFFRDLKLMFLRQSVEVRESHTTVPVLRLQESETVLATG